MRAPAELEERRPEPRRDGVLFCEEDALDRVERWGGAVERGDRVLVLSAFGVGQSCNSPDMVGEIWADLLCARGAKFQGVFERVVFALSAKHRETFEKAFNEKILEREVFTEDFD